MHKKAAIVLNAPYLDVTIEEQDVICADGGRDLVVGSLLPIALVGDFDSYVGMKENSAEQTVVCPTIKDYTDGERAVEFAAEKGYEEIVIYGAQGGRSDHVYANFSLLDWAKRLGLKAKIKSKTETVFLMDETDGRIILDAQVGDIVSVLPYEEETTVSNSVGLFYPYNALTLTRTRATGISNVVTRQNPSFNIVKGKALVFVISNKEVKKQDES